MEGPSLVGSVTLVDTYTSLRVPVPLTGGMISEDDIVRVLPVLAPLRVLVPKGPDDWFNREVDPVSYEVDFCFCALLSRMSASRRLKFMA
jgi:hypothetical protein